MVGDFNLGDTTDLKRRTAIGAIWMTGARWLIRILGLVNIVVVARLVAPEDFGLIAMAMVIVGFVGTLTEMGTDIAIIRLPSLEREHLDTAWTISAGIGFIAAALVFLLAQPVATYYDDDRVAEILRWTSIVPLLQAAISPRIALFRKNLKFAWDFLFESSTKILQVLITVTAAIILMNYWALVIGTIAGAAARFLLSFIMAPMLPKPTLSRRHDVLSVSAWLLLRNIGFALSRLGGRFVLGGAVSAETLSYFYIGGQVGRMLNSELALPLGRALLPAYARIQNNPVRMLRGIRQSLSAISLVIPVGFGLSATSDEFIYIVFGQTWLPAADLLAIFSALGAISIMSAPLGPVLLAVGKAKQLSLTYFIGGFVTLTIVFIVVKFGATLSHVALVQGFIGIITSLILMKIALHNSPGEMIAILIALSRPIAASSAMWLAIAGLRIVVDFGPIVGALVYVPFGVLVFFMSLGAIWILAGRPNGGLEALLVDTLRQAWRRRR